MMEHFSQNTTEISRYVFIGLTLIVGSFMLWLITRICRARFQKRFNPHVAMLLTNLVFYMGAGLIFAMVIYQAGFNISTLFKTAGIIGIAVGFAAQTTISNFISGIFLLAQRPFVVGDYIYIQALTSSVPDLIGGTVESIDLMSTVMVTPDKSIVRVPNRVIIDNPFFNKTSLHQQRMDIEIEIYFPEAALKDEIIKQVQQSLLACRFILHEPKPLFAIKQVSKESLTLLFRFWAQVKVTAAGDLLVDKSDDVRLNISDDLSQRVLVLREKLGLRITVAFADTKK